MQFLKNLSPTRFSTVSFRWGYIIAITVSTLALFRMLNPNLLSKELKPGVQEVVLYNNYSWQLNAQAENALFIEFGAIRRTVSEIITMIVSSNSADKKIIFLDICTNFVRERLQSLLQTEERFRVVLENQLYIERSFNALKINYDDKQFDKNVEHYLTQVQKWLSTVSDVYQQIMNGKRKQCLRKMETIERSISQLIFEIQHGYLCEKNTTVLHFSDVGKGNPRPAKNLGMGSLLHRIETCIAVSLQIGSPCLIDDFHWEYDQNNLGKYYRDIKICSSAEKRWKREQFISTDVGKDLVKYVLNVPLSVKTALDYCHEDPTAWYRGVILKHMLQFSDFSEQAIKRLLKETNLVRLSSDITEIMSVHIRSTEKKETENVLPARQYFLALKYLCLVRPHLCRSQTAWVATDDNKNWISFDSEMRKDKSSMRQFKTFTLNVSEEAERYTPNSLLQFFTDLRVLTNAKLTIGTMFSNLLLYTYEYKCVDDPHASDRVLSLDHFYYPFLRKRPFKFMLLSPNFLYLAPSVSDPSNNLTIWPQKVIINEAGVLGNTVRISMENPTGKAGPAPVIRGGLLEVAFVNRSIFSSNFYTPYFNLLKVTTTVSNSS